MKTNLGRRKFYTAEARLRVTRGFWSFVVWSVALLGSTGALAAYFFWASVRDWSRVDSANDLAAAQFWCVVFVIVLLGAILRMHCELFEPHRLVPYFSGDLPANRARRLQAPRFGERLLENSLILDGLAKQAGLPTFGSFITTCQSYYGPARAWFAPADGLRLVNGLLDQQGSHPAVIAARSDLEYLRERFGQAMAAGVQFCLFLRQGYGGNIQTFACEDVRN